MQNNPASINNITGRDIPREIIANAKRRREQAARDQRSAEIIEAILFALAVLLYLFALKAFIR